MNDISFVKGDLALSVRHYPGRKKPCLVVERGNCGLVVGTLRNESMVKEFELALKELFKEGII